MLATKLLGDAWARLGVCTKFDFEELGLKLGSNVTIDSTCDSKIKCEGKALAYA